MIEFFIFLLNLIKASLLPNEKQNSRVSNPKTSNICNAKYFGRVPNSFDLMILLLMKIVYFKQ